VKRSTASLKSGLATPALPLAALLAALLTTASLAALVHAAPADKAATGTSASSSNAPAVVDSLGLLERAVAKDSSKFDNLYKLGVMYLDRDRTAEATRVLLRANKARPKDVKTLVNLGAAFDAAGNQTQAQVYYRQAIELSPEDSVATCRLASSLYAQAKYQDSIDLLRDVIKKRPQSYCAYFTLGVAFADAGLYRDAIRMWRKVVDYGSGTPESVSAMESIEVLEIFVPDTSSPKPATPAPPAPTKK
jgi:tetratricopeptide (TPR) repeat protein